MKRILLLSCLLVLLVGCGSEPAATPDLVATQVAVMEAAAATLTAGAPSATATAVSTQMPTETPSATATATLLPTVPPTVALSTMVPPTATRPPQPTPRPPTPTKTPAVGPSLGPFTVVGVYGDDVLNVRSGPGVDQHLVGTIPYYGQSVEVHAGGQKVGDSWWVPVRYGKISGWANSEYLARQEGTVSDEIAARAAEAILALRDRDFTELAGLVHPVRGVTFSPYTYVRPLQGAPGEADLVFSRDQLLGLWNDPTVYHWGTYDGSGEPIDLTFRQYYDRFVYDVDFAQPDVIGFNQIVGQGNTINNIATVYPLGVPVEYHFEGFDPQYQGMDWRSLRLVLEEYEGAWYVVGIVHDEWTI
jgi:Bacterial SH3 domain